MKEGRHAMKARALSGIRVIDLGSVWSGPMASQLLADMGAEVIKIEHKEKLDSSRFRGKHIKEPRDLELSPYFHDINRNKLSINLNLRIPKGLTIFKDLIKISDAVIENFSVGVVEKLGIDYRNLSEVNPQLIYLSMPTAGLSGPLKNMIGYAHYWPWRPQRSHPWSDCRPRRTFQPKENRRRKIY
jgi:crotonobetainyl-CoA:carnitine CoA-transferase CaiB-like acyl-CoA transferase